jgi:hypothetical protein
MLNAAHDVEYMYPYPAGYVKRRISSQIEAFPIGASIKFEPDDYSGIPLFHFHNTLKSTLASEYGSDNIQTVLDAEHGVIEALRLR